MSDKIEERASCKLQSSCGHQEDLTKPTTCQKVTGTSFYNTNSACASQKALTKLIPCQNISGTSVFAQKEGACGETSTNTQEWVELWMLFQLQANVYESYGKS